MNHYELLYIIPLKINMDENPDPIINKVTETLNTLGAEITSQENLSKKKLAYPINNIRYGYYILVEFNMSGEGLMKLQRELTLSADILRFQVVKKKIKSPEELAREKTLQDKLRAKHAKEELEAEMVEKEKQDRVDAKKTPTESTKIDDLDKKLEEILEQEIVK
jgi:small subunit ribosomal protein S6